MQTRRILALSALAAGALTLSACQTVQDTLGMAKSSPDEFQTVPKRPLSMPPDFALPAPQPGAAARADIDTQTAARTAIAASATGPVQAAPAASAPASAPEPAPASQSAAPPAPAGAGSDILNAPGRR